MHQGQQLRVYVMKISIILTFYFHWHYNPLWVLALSVIFFHSALSPHCFLHCLTPIICKSSLMPAIYLFCGLPLVLVPISFHRNILLGFLLSFIRLLIQYNKGKIKHLTETKNLRIIQRRGQKSSPSQVHQLIVTKSRYSTTKK